jgi:hypothetical protein
MDFATTAEQFHRTETDEVTTQNSDSYVTLCIMYSLGNNVTVTHLAVAVRMWTILNWVYRNNA